MMKTLFLQPPSFDGFDGGAGSRYQAQARDPVVLVSDLAGAARGAGRGQQADRRAAARHRASTTVAAAGASDYDLVRDAHLDAVLRLRREDRRGAEGGQSARSRSAWSAPRSRSMPDEQPDARRGRSTSSPATSSTSPSRKSPRAATWPTIDGISLSQRRRRDRPQHGPRDPARTWTSCRSSRRSTSATCTIENYFIGYLKHPYVSLYTGRGCKSRCTFCLWPQTVGGHRYRTRSVGHVIEEIALGASRPSRR